MQQDILEKFTDHLKHALSRSIDTAWETKQPSISLVLLLYGIATQKGSIASQLLSEHNITGELIHTEYLGTRSVDSISKKKEEQSTTQWLELSDEARGAIERAARIAMDFQHQYIGTEHLLMSLLEQQDSQLHELLEHVQASTAGLQQKLFQVLHGTAKFNNIQQGIFNSANQMPRGAGAPGAGQPQSPSIEHTEHNPHATPALDFFGVDLTQRAEDGLIDPVIGRSEEIERLIHILSRRTKNNPVLVGDPGVGKTAIVEGLARRIVEADVPDMLLHKRVVGLDLSLVVAGSMYRGEFESRLQQIIEELRKNPDILLFIDEVHTIVGAGGVQGGNMDAANILKPALAKGEITCIGATTHEEYRKYIEQDSALERRFQPIIVKEPSAAEAVQILRGIAGYYESHHHVTLTKEAIQAAVELSDRFIPEHRLPDKAIDLIDEASAKVRVQQPVPEAVKHFARTDEIQRKLQEQKKKAVEMQQFDIAVELKEDEAELRQMRADLRALIGNQPADRIEITADDIAAVASSRTGIPKEFMIASSITHHTELGDKLRKRIIGQDAAIDTVLKVMKRAAAGLADPNRPLGSFLFLGSSGIGKTELAKSLAQEYFGDAEALIRMDMSEFNEGFTVSKLVGAPAGYVGHNDGIKLADQIRKKPYSVVLFDELEKAHPDIFNILLQILDDGRLTDSTGRELNFRNAIIIMTSNIGIELLTKQAALGFEHEQTNQEKPLTHEEIQNIIGEEVRAYLPVEFLNRIDYQIVFEPLSEKAMEQIVALQFTGIAERLKQRGIKSRLLTSAKRTIAEASFTPDQGARRVRRTLSQLVEDTIAEMIIDGTLTPGSTARIGGNGDKIAIEVVKTARPTKKTTARKRKKK